MHTYVPGGTVPATTWQDAGETTPNSNPITLDAAGSCLLYGSGSYQLTVTDSRGNAVPAYSGVTSTIISASTFSTIAALRANNSAVAAPFSVYIEGYTNPADGGEGNFIYEPSDTSSVDNGGTIIVDAFGNRWHRGVSGQPLSILWFGADPTASADSLPAWNSLAAVAAASGSGASILFPHGKYKFSGPATFTFPSGVFDLSIRGYGAILFWPATGGGMSLSLSSPMHTFNVQGMHFTVGVANGGNGFSTTQSVALQSSAQQSFRDVVFRGDDNTGNGGSFYWSNCVQLSSLTGANFEACTFQGGNVSSGVFGGEGIAFIGTSLSQEGLFCNCSGCFFFGLATAILYGPFVQAITLSQTFIVGCNLGVASLASEGGSLEELTITGSDIECTSGCIALLTGVPFVIIQGTIFAGTANNATIWLPQCMGALLTGNQIAVNSATGSSGILLQDSTSPSTITGNVITGAEFGVNLGTGSNNVTVVGNNIDNCTTPVGDFGTANFIANNLGVPVVHTTPAAPGGSPYSYTAGSRPEALFISSTGTITQILLPDGAGMLGNVVGADQAITIPLYPHMTVQITFTGTLTANGVQL